MSLAPLPEVDQPGVLVIIRLNAPIHIVTSFGPLGQPTVTVGWTIIKIHICKYSLKHIEAAISSQNLYHNLTT